MKYLVTENKRLLVPGRKALSVRQPWSWLICAGYKDVENRAWTSPFRGRIYIHAGQRRDEHAWPYIANAYRHLLTDEARDALALLWLNWRGAAIIGEADIVDCVSASTSPWFEGPYAFVLANPVLYSIPIPCKGHLGFFEPEIPPSGVPVEG